jgi:hypothetical protein
LFVVHAYCSVCQTGVGPAGSLESKTPKERRGKINNEELLRLLADPPGWYVREFAERFNACPQAAHKMFEKLRLLPVKKLLPVPRNRKKTGKSS